MLYRLGCWVARKQHIKIFSVNTMIMLRWMSGCNIKARTKKRKRDISSLN